MQVLETREKIASLWESEEARIQSRLHPSEVPPLPSHPAGRYTDREFFGKEHIPEHLQVTDIDLPLVD